MTKALYNEIDPYCVDWLKNLISRGLIANGDVADCSIADLKPSDLAGYTQVHLFAGIGGWSLAARLAGFPDSRSLWTGSCPCQPFSVAGAGKGQEDARHLWPEFFRLIAACRPAVVMGEQVAAAVGKSWLDGVFADLESIAYTGRAAVVPACAVNAPHRRDRLWFVADRDGSMHDGTGRFGASGRAQHSDRGGHGDDVADSDGTGIRDEPRRRGGPDGTGTGQHWDDCESNVADRAGLRGQVDPNTRGSTPRDGAGEFAGPGSPRNGNVADRDGERWPPRHRDGSTLGHGNSATASGCHVGDGDGRRRFENGCYESVGDFEAYRGRSTDRVGNSGSNDFWSDSVYVSGADGKARRVKSGIRLLANGIPARVGKLRAFGNAIVPQVAAEIIGAYLDTNPSGAPILSVPPLPY